MIKKISSRFLQPKGMTNLARVEKRSYRVYRKRSRNIIKSKYKLSISNAQEDLFMSSLMPRLGIALTGMAIGCAHINHMSSIYGYAAGLGVLTIGTYFFTRSERLECRKKLRKLKLDRKQEYRQIDLEKPNKQYLKSLKYYQVTKSC